VGVGHSSGRLVPELSSDFAAGFETSNQVCKCDEDEDCTCGCRVL